MVKEQQPQERPVFADRKAAGCVIFALKASQLNIYTSADMKVTRQCRLGVILPLASACDQLTIDHLAA